jgi:hypothetical protein
MGSTIEELLERKSSSSGLENRDYGWRDPSRCPRGTLYPQQLTLTSSTSGGRSVGIVRSRTQAMGFSLVFSLFIFIFPLHVLTLVGHLQAEYTIIFGKLPHYNGSSLLYYSSYFVYVLANTTVV